MSEKKPLSDKKMRRLMKIEKKKQEKKQSKETKASQQHEESLARRKDSLRAFVGPSLPDECYNMARPQHLRGKEIGMWYRDRRRKRHLEDASNPQPGQSTSAQSTSKKEKKLSKSERKAQKKAERMTKITQRRDEKVSLGNDCFKIVFDPNREKMIQDFLNSVKDTPPSFLIPLSEYHKKLRLKHPIDDSDECNLFEGGDIPEDEDVESTLAMTQKLYEKFPFDMSMSPPGITVDGIQAFLRRETNEECLQQVASKAQKLYQQNERIFSGNMTVEDNCMDSIDKYKHLEETSFKQNFLAVLSSNIQDNLRNAVKHNSLTRNARLDKELFNELESKYRNPRFGQMLRGRERLPAFQMQNEIIELIEQNRVILISGETGCGKTTQVAQFILDRAIANSEGSVCNVICTQPRRISAISVAQRVADERAETVGRESIGYQIRLEKKIGRHRGSILYCTTGILLQYMQGDPALSKYSHIIIDEIHERDVLCDFVLTILRSVTLQRKDLKIILMSATLNAERFSEYFGNCPQIEIPGYTYPVEELYLEEVLLFTGFQFDEKKKKNKSDDPDFKKHIIPYAQGVIKGKYPEHVIEGLCHPESEKVNANLIISLVKHICECQGQGAILIFVPGWEDISSILKKMNEDEYFGDQHLMIPLHSMLSTASQQSVFDRPPPGKRKIVIATNIAETSITINDVVFVIDCGKIKVKNYDVNRNISTLKPEFVSLANAHQRRGRAGRVQSGVCYHLYSRARAGILAHYPLPEMLRTRLEDVVLNIKLLQLGKAAPFLGEVMDPPNPKAVSLAIDLLVQLNALDENENLTPLGFHLAKLPLDPQIGKMLLMAVTMSCLNPILSIAATLGFKDPFQVPLGKEREVKERKLELDNGHKSDHLIMAEVIERWETLRWGPAKQFCHQNFLNINILRQLKDQKSLFTQYLHDMGFINNMDYKCPNLNKNSRNVALVKAVICSGLYPNIAIINPKLNPATKRAPMLKTCEDGRVTLHPKSVNSVQVTSFESNFLVYHEKLMSSCIFIFDSTMVATLPLLIFGYDFYLTYKNEDKAIIELNKDVRFECSSTTAHYITELKLRLNWLLEYKLSHPGQIMWVDNSSDIGLLKTLTDLFTNENDLVMRARDDSSDEY